MIFFTLYINNGINIMSGNMTDKEINEYVEMIKEKSIK